MTCAMQPRSSRLWNQPSHPSIHQQEGLSCGAWTCSLRDQTPSQPALPAEPQHLHVARLVPVKLDHSHSLSSERNHSRGRKQQIRGKGPVVHKPCRTTTSPHKPQGLSLHQLPLLTLRPGRPSGGWRLEHKAPLVPHALYPGVCIFQLLFSAGQGTTVQGKLWTTP